MKKIKNYSVQTECLNCFSVDDVFLPQGELAKTALKTKPCEYCGCKKLTQIDDSFHYFDQFDKELDKITEEDF